MAKRYRVRYDGSSKQFLVLDTLVGTLAVGNHPSVAAAAREAVHKEHAWEYGQRHLGPSEIFDWLVAP